MSTIADAPDELRDEAVEDTPAAAFRAALPPLPAGELERDLSESLAQPRVGVDSLPDGVRPSRLQLLDALIAAKTRQRTAESDQIALVSGLCDAYSCLESNPGGDAETSARVLFGESLLPPSFDGAHPVAEFFGHELGPALGISPDSAWVLVWDVLALRHRHPILWHHALTGAVEVWLARKAARACMSLPAAKARELDSVIGPAMPGWGPVKLMTEVTNWRTRLDPEAEAKREQAKRARSVSFRPHDDADGLTAMDAALDSVDARHLAGTLDTLAGVLKTGGVDGTLDELRAVALGHLAHPDRAARLLQPDLLDAGATVTPDGHIVNTDTGEIVTRTDRVARCRHGAELVVHLSGRDLACRSGAQVEGLGPITHSHLTDLLAACAGYVRVRPVVDLGGPFAVATYRPSPEMIWRLKNRDGREMFPFSQRSTHSTRVDMDHTVAWDPDGGDEQTAMDNLGPNARRTHRAQTHGAFAVEQPRPGVFRWTTPLGKTYWTSCHGTWTGPPPDVVSNDPDETTSIVLANLLRAAATNVADTGQTTRQRARAARTANARRSQTPHANPTGSSPDPASDDPWQASPDTPPPF